MAANSQSTWVILLLTMVLSIHQFDAALVFTDERLRSVSFGPKTRN